MKSLLLKLLNVFIKPFYGTGIGNYPPFKQIHLYYKYLNRNQKKIFFDPSGFYLNLDLNKSIYSDINIYGYYEKSITEILQKYLKKGDVFLDIGANIGYFSLLGSKLVGNSGKVISLEPVPKIYKSFVKNIKLNNFRNIKAINLGVGKEEREIEIYYNNDNPGASSVVKGLENSGYEKYIISIVILDNFISSIGEKNIDFIKMDIEGFEYEAIKGMKNILKKNKDIKIVFEYSPITHKNITKNAKSYSIGLLKELYSLGFLLFHIEEGKEKKLIKDFDMYYDTIVSGKGGSDILCIRS